ncbi:unnamed protein product [Phyllotreta striolata]|uniref:Arginase n=1 Tax=Phyllotreta striolata TaxID=444603 RepID=A0A9N9TR06_PHYSR|nr:unnamed protein product [Phyllotreta striolata]
MLNIFSSGSRCAFRRCFSTKPKVGILGVPFGKGGEITGAHNGPDSIRKAGLIDRLAGIGDDLEVKDYGNLEYDVIQGIDTTVPNMKNYHDIISCNQVLSQKVESILKEGQVCLALGGDHSIAIGTIDGHVRAKKDVSVLYIDAHPDLNTNKTSDSGNIHGMPLGILVSELSDYWPYLPGMDWQKPILSLRNVAYIGLRSVDPYERLIIDKLGVTAYDMDDVEEHGISSVISMALKAIDPEENRSIHVSFDIDALDSLVAPSTGYPIPGGLTLREGVQILEKVFDTGRLGAMDLVEVNPNIGSKEDVRRTVEAAVHLILAAFGNKRRGVRPKNETLPLQTFPPTRPQIA